jgi:transposase-like protein
MSTPSPQAPWPMELKLQAARDQLKRGASLQEAANTVGMKPAALDLMLWKTLGAKR